MNSWPALGVILLISGCSGLTGPKYCYLDVEQIPAAVKDAQIVLAELASDSVVYQMSGVLETEGRLYRDKDGRCWSYIYPKSVDPDRSVLHGEGALYIDTITLKAGPISWFKY